MTAIVILFGLARRTARQIEKVLLFYTAWRPAGLGQARATRSSPSRPLRAVQAPGSILLVDLAGAPYLLRQISLFIGKVTGSKEIFGGVGTRVVGVEKLRKSINRRAPLLVLAQLLCRAVQFRLGGRWLLLRRLLARI